MPSMSLGSSGTISQASEVMSIWLAVHPMILSEQEVEDGIRNGAIFDAKTLSAWLAYRLNVK